MPKKAFLKSFLIVFGVFLLLTLILTFPLILHLNSSAFGFTSDNFSSIWFFGEWGRAGLELSRLNSTDVRYPFGVDLTSLPPEFGWSLPFLLLTYLSNELIAFNLMSIFGFVFTGVSMYYLVFYLTRERNVSYLIGFIFAFAPYHFWQAFVHFNLGFLYTLPLYTLALLYFDRSRTLKSGLYLGLGFLLTFFTSLYYGLFVIFLSISYFLTQLIVTSLKGKSYLSLSFFKAAAVALIPILVAVSPLLYRVFIQKTGFGTSGSLPTRPLNDLLSLSMRPWDFLLPAPNHPFLGRLSDNLLKWIQTKSVDFKTISAFLPERVNFIGITTFVAFIVSCVVIFLKRKNRQLTLVLLFTLILILLVSAPPFVILKGITVKFPSTYIYPFLPFFRVYARLGVLVLLLVLLVLSLGLMSFKNTAQKKWLLGCLSILIFFEFLPFGWGQTTTLKNQAVYDWVKNTPGGTVVAEYPVDFDIADALIWQRYHQKKLYNALYGDEVVPIKQLNHLESPQTWLILKASGVNYVILHTKYLYDKPHPINDFYYKEFVTENLNIDPSLAEEVAHFDNAKVYKPKVKQAEIVYLDGKSKEYSFLVKPKWEWSEVDNVIYLNNVTSEVMKGKIDFQVRSGGISNQLLAGQKFTLDQQVEIKPGINELILTNRKPTDLVTIDDFRFSVLP